MNSGDTTTRLRGRRSALPATMRAVADLILENPADCSHMTITELAGASGVSQSTVVRLARELGYTGYRGLRAALVAEVAVRRRALEAEAADGDILPDDEIGSVVRKIASADVRAIEATAAAIDLGALSHAADMLLGARTISLFGLGASHVVALDLQQKLSRIGRFAVAPSDAHAALTTVALLGGCDALLVVSHSGRTTDVIDVVREAAARTVPTIAVTNDPGSPVAQSAGTVLLTAAQETQFRSGATASRLAQLTVLDCLFMTVAQRSYDESRRALTETYEVLRDRRA